MKITATPGKPRDADADKGGWEQQDQDAVAKSLNGAWAASCGALIAKRASLRDNFGGSEKRDPRRRAENDEHEAEKLLVRH